MRALLVLLAASLLLPLAGAWPPDTPCVRKVLTYEIVIGCRGTDGRTDALCYYVVHQSSITTEMVCWDSYANSNGDACLTIYYSVTYDPYHRHDDVPACIPGAV